MTDQSQLKQSRPDQARPDPSLLDWLAAALGADAVAVGDAIGAGHDVDFGGERACRPAALLKPGTPEEVSRALALCSAARQPIVVEAPTASDNCPFTLTGTILADATLPSAIPVTGGTSVTLPVGAHRIVWQAADGAQVVTRTQTIVVSDPPARRLANGDMLFTVTLPG